MVDKLLAKVLVKINIIKLEIIIVNLGSNLIRIST